MEIVQVNLVVADLELSRSFYAGLGCALRPVPGEGGEPVAWLAEDGPIPVGLHSPEFAAWWGASSGGPRPGTTVIDLCCDQEETARLLAAAKEQGGRVVQPLRDMPWGQAYAIIADPDGYHWGLKTPLPAEQH